MEKSKEGLISLIKKMKSRCAGGLLIEADDAINYLNNSEIVPHKKPEYKPLPTGFKPTRTGGNY
jgi:hypothetical protein